MRNLLSAKICLVTGTSRGIGRTIAENFASEGGIVYSNARTEGVLDDWAYKVNSHSPGQIIPVYFDIKNSSQIRDTILKIKKEQGRFDVLVNNAGIVQNELLGMISIGKMKEMFDVNVFGLMELSQLVATKFMMKQRDGSIVNIASIVGVEGSSGQIAYSASKGAVISMTKSMSKELAPYNIRVNAVAPGMIETERLNVTIKNQYKENIPPLGMGRMGTTKEISDACLYFSSDLSSYTTGQILVVGGGMTL